MGTDSSRSWTRLLYGASVVFMMLGVLDATLSSYNPVNAGLFAWAIAFIVTSVTFQTTKILGVLTFLVTLTMAIFFGLAFFSVSVHQVSTLAVGFLALVTLWLIDTIFMMWKGFDTSPYAAKIAAALCLIGEISCIVLFSEAAFSKAHHGLYTIYVGLFIFSLVQVLNWLIWQVDVQGERNSDYVYEARVLVSSTTRIAAAVLFAIALYATGTAQIRCIDMGYTAWAVMMFAMCFERGEWFLTPLSSLAIKK